MSPTEPREEALKALYEADQRREEGGPPRKPGGRAGRIVEGVLAHREALDEAIGTASVGWRVERMPAVDRNILRIGLYELRYMPETPVPVIISEAVKLAKDYSTTSSGRFVNGVLAALARRERDASSQIDRGGTARC